MTQLAGEIHQVLEKQPPPCKYIPSRDHSPLLTKLLRSPPASSCSCRSNCAAEAKDTKRQTLIHRVRFACVPRDEAHLFAARIESTDPRQRHTMAAQMILKSGLACVWVCVCSTASDGSSFCIQCASLVFSLGRERCARSHPHRTARARRHVCDVPELPTHRCYAIRGPGVRA